MTTSTISPDQTVGTIAAERPASVRVFEKYKIDFCCGGRIPLTEACSRTGADPLAVLADLEQAGVSVPDDTDWQTAKITSLIDHIVAKHHAYLQSELPRLEAMLEKLLTKHSEAHGDVLVPLLGIFRELRDELLPHLMKEEMILFPLIRQLDAGDKRAHHCGSVQNPLRVMFMEHDAAGAALVHMRELTSGFTAPPDACNTYRACFYELAELESDLHRHIHLENNILFPRAVALES